MRHKNGNQKEVEEGMVKVRDLSFFYFFNVGRYAITFLASRFTFFQGGVLKFAGEKRYNVLVMFFG